MTHRAFLTCLTAALGILGISTGNAEASGHAGQSASIELPLSSLPTEPEHLYAAPTRPDRIGRVMAPVMINGQGPFRFIVDTGANQSVITARVATALGLTWGDRSVKLTGVTGSLMVPTVPIDRLATGELQQQGLEIPVIGSVMGGGDGILGMQGFAGKRITVDFANDRIQIATSRGQRVNGSLVRVPVKIRFDKLLLATGRVDGVKVKAVIDTGAQRTLGNQALRDELLRRKRIRGEPQRTGVIGLTDVEQEGHAIFTRRISLGDLTINDVDVIYGDIHVFRLWELEEEPALLVGMDVLGVLHTLIVDYRLRELQVRVK